MTEDKMVSLGDIAKKHKIPKSKLHYYAKLGLIVPKGVTGKMQIYIESEIEERLKKIDGFRKKGMSLSDIKSLL
jgi:DNA-binding transcriptional MerR regulator